MILAMKMSRRLTQCYELACWVNHAQDTGHIFLQSGVYGYVSTALSRSQSIGRELPLATSSVGDYNDTVHLSATDVSHADTFRSYGEPS